MSEPTHGTFPVPPGGRVHLVGIGGAGMSAIARVLRERGYEVTGSDQRESEALAALRELGVTVSIGHQPDGVEGADLVVASAAVPPDNVELVSAREVGIPVIARSVALARLVDGARTVAVAGTHGKTTTSGMVATITQSAGLDPTWLLGADLAGRGPGGRQGAGTLAVVEADEAYGSFLELEPSIALVTNIEEDHLDHYGTMEALIKAFERFVGSAREAVVLCADDPGTLALSRCARGGRVITYGLGDQEPAEVSATSVEPGAGGSSFCLTIGGRPATGVRLRISGRHNVQNALGAAGAALALGLEPAAIAEGLSAFAGAKRRFEYRGSIAGADLFDDYAHHPTEVAATLEAARSGPWRRVVAVFQPHLYSRTQAMWRAFGSALAQADVVVVTDVYGAREQPVAGVTGKLIVDAVCDARPGRPVAYFARLDEAAGYVRDHLRQGDLVLSMGAGDITTLPQRIMHPAEAAR